MNPLHIRPKSVVIMDIDGCLLDSSKRLPLLLAGDRDAYDAAHHTDIPYPAGVAVYETLLQRYTCLFVTSRIESAREYTKTHINRHLRYLVPDSQLLMRPDGDRTPDAQLKPRLIAESGYELEHILLAVDDSDEMVAEWRRLGIECWQPRSTSTSYKIPLSDEEIKASK